MRALLFVAVALSLMPLGLVQAGSHGPCGETGSPGIVAVGPAYVNVRGANQGVWIYLETNGIANLQRGGDGVLPGDHDDCYDDSIAGPDLLIV